MKKSLLIIFFSLISYALCSAQSTEKVKGNRMVSIQATDISSFHTIDLDEDFEVEIVYAKLPYVEIETDENLHQFIEFQVIDSVLTFNKTIKITSKKRLNITVAYDDALNHIETSGDAEILSLSTINFASGSLKARESSKVGLTVKSDSFKVDADDKTKIKLNVTSDTCVVNLSGNSKIDALINTNEMAATLYQRSHANIEGNCDFSNINMDNNTEFNGKNFSINTCEVLCAISSDAYLEVRDLITIKASGASSIYLYNDPKIEINKLTDTSKIQKKEK